LNDVGVHLKATPCIFRNQFVILKLAAITTSPLFVDYCSTLQCKDVALKANQASF
jgi:hypothetical protein